jgi:superfamily II DNA/RNA helicase
VQRVNDTTVGKEPDAEDNLHSGGTAGLLKKALEEQGIHDIAELHGGNKGKGKAAGAMNDFQSGKHRVIIATVESGGTGVNLDDRNGDAPRTTIMMTPPLGATPYMQALGRTHRKTTRSKSEVVNLYGDTDVEKWNRAIIDSKLSSLHAITGSKQHDDGIEHLANLSGEAIEEMAAHRDLEKPDKDAEREARDLDRLRVNLGMNKPETSPEPIQHTVPVTGVSAATHTNSDHEHLIKNGVNPEHVGRFKKYIRVSGNTYANKDKIRSIGGEYDGGDKVWHVPLKHNEEEGSNDISTYRYLSKLPGLNLQHVWHDRSTKRNVPRNA